MFKLKKVLPVLLIALCMLLVSAAPAQAAQPTYARYGLTASDAIETSTSLVFGPGTWVYGWKIFADVGNSVAALHDSATHEAATASNVVDEIGEVTQYDDTTNWFTRPIYFTNGVSVVMPGTLGVVIVWAGPQPAGVR